MSAWHFFVHWTGGDFGASAYGYLEPYDWLSGIFGLTFLGLLYQHYRKNNCHVQWCWRIGRRLVPGTDWRACNRHHPDKPPSHEHMLARHRIYLGSKPGRG